MTPHTECLALVFQSAEKAASNSAQCGFESHPGHPSRDAEAVGRWCHASSRVQPSRPGSGRRTAGRRSEPERDQQSVWGSRERRFESGGTIPPRPTNHRRTAHDATAPCPWTRRPTATFSGSTSAKAASVQGGSRSTRYASPATSAIPGSSSRPVTGWPRSGPAPRPTWSPQWDASMSWGTGSTGRACSRSTVPDASTNDRSSSPTGSARSSHGIPGASCAACSTPTAAGSPTGRYKRWPAGRSATSTLATSDSFESADIVALCTWALDLLGVAWRLPRHNMVSVARREAVALLDTHVGPKS